MSVLVTVVRHLQHRNNDPRIAANPNNYHVDIRADIPYLPDGGDSHLLDIYSPKDAKGKLPVILEVHGGAYVSCYKEINAQHGQYFASRGFRVVNMNYTLCPEADLRMIIREIFTVASWIREHSEEYGFDVTRLYLTGDSTGGHMVLLAATVQSDRKCREYFAPAEPIQPFTAIAASCPMASLEDLRKPKTTMFRLMRAALKVDLKE